MLAEQSRNNIRVAAQSRRPQPVSGGACTPAATPQHECSGLLTCRNAGARSLSRGRLSGRDIGLGERCGTPWASPDPGGSPDGGNRAARCPAGLAPTGPSRRASGSSAPVLDPGRATTGQAGRRSRGRAAGTMGTLPDAIARSRSARLGRFGGRAGGGSDSPYAVTIGGFDPACAVQVGSNQWCVCLPGVLKAGAPGRITSVMGSVLAAGACPTGAAARLASNRLW